MKLKIEYVDINSIRPYEKNAKLHPEEQIEQIKKSIEQFGMDDPIGIWKDEIVEGHGRLIACKELGMKEVPIIRLDHLTDEERKAYTLAHNKLTMNSDFDLDILNDELDNILDIDMSDFGFDLDFEDEEEKEIVEDEEDLFDDIEKLDKHYGVPYQGNKSRIADIIVNILPNGKRLVDLFGGGGAITHCALLSNKWENYLYNDINPLITTLFIDAVNGKYHDENRVITRQDFEELKDTDAYVKYIWSFGNNGTGYLWGKDIEDIKCTACHSLLDDTLNERRLSFIHFIQMLKESKDITPNRLAPLERLQALTQLEALQRLEISNISYKDYKYQDGDIVYCDVPYEKDSKGNCNDYGVYFNSKEFYKWVKDQPYQVYFSSYEISDDSFYKIKLKSVMSLIGANTNGQFVNEYLYSNKEIIINE